MLYLFRAKAIDNAIAGPPDQVIPLIENVIMPSFKMLAEGERSKKISGCSLAGQRGWVVIADFPSHEEANKWAMNMPFWNIQTVEIMPLVSFQSQLDLVTKLVQNVRSMLRK